MQKSFSDKENSLHSWNYQFGAEAGDFSREDDVVEEKEGKS